MNSFWGEVHKLYQNKIFLLALLVSFIVNGLLLYKYSIVDENRFSAYTIAEYEEFKDYLLSLDNLQEVNDEIKNECYAIVEGDDRKYLNLILDWNKEINNCTNYHDSLVAMVNQQKIVLNTGLFLTEYDYLKNEKVVNDYDALLASNINPKLSNWKGISLLADTSFTELILLALVFVIIFVLLIDEREIGHFLLLKSTYNGRRELCFTKILALVINVFLIGVFFYGVNLFVEIKLYGLGDITGHIQSVSVFTLCPYNISILEYIVYSAALKIMGLLAIACTMFLVGVVSVNSIRFVLFGGFTIGIGIIINIIVKENVSIEFIKCLSLVDFFYIDQYFKSDTIVNFFGVPVYAINVNIISRLIYILLGIYYSILFWEEIREASFSTGRKWINPFNKLGNKSTSVLFHENYKFWISGPALFMTIILAGYIGYSYKPANERFSIVEEKGTTYYLELLKGDVTEEKLKYLESEKQRYKDIRDRYESLTPDELYGGEANNLRTQLEYEDGFMYVFEVLTPYLLSVKGQYIYPTGYKLLTGDIISMDIDTFLALLYALMLVLPLSWLFGCEYPENMYTLQKSTYLGRHKVTSYKLLIGICYSLLIFILVYVPYYWSVISVFGVDGIDYKAVSLMNISGAPDKWSIFTYMMFITGMRIVYGMVIVLTAFAFSTVVKNLTVTIVMLTAIFLAPLLLVYLGLTNAELFVFNPLVLGNSMFRGW